MYTYNLVIWLVVGTFGYATTQRFCICIKHTQTHKHTQTCTHTHTRTRIHTHTHTHTHTQTHTHIIKPYLEKIIQNMLSQSNMTT